MFHQLNHQLVYFLTEKRPNRINIYDVNWNLLIRIKGNLTSENGYLNKPLQLIISSVLTLYVSDYLNRRVEEFPLDGNWLRTVLDGISKQNDLPIHLTQPVDTST